MSRAWNCAGGGRAHARTFKTLGFDCVGQTADAYYMRRGTGPRVAVPRLPWLADDVIRWLQSAAGVSRGEYVSAWARKARVLGCPPPDSIAKSAA